MIYYFAALFLFDLENSRFLNEAKYLSEHHFSAVGRSRTCFENHWFRLS